MKVDNSIQSVPNVSTDGKKNTESLSAPGVSQENKTVHISPQASNLQSLSSTESGSVADMARVQDIKQAISEGSFRVNSEVVADRLLETVQELIQSKEGSG